MAMPSGSELLLIFGIVVLLFGAKKIPDLAKSIGQGIRGFKKEMKDEDTAPPPTPTPEPTVHAVPEAPKQVENVTTVEVEAPQTTTKQA
ncbi:MAG: twin-arginine translocase TatA/TatE family subunit [Sulfuricurvum sp.]|jgi:sec-independent protein translocase protein TatA